ncbi:MAG: hypothetical protein NTW03_13215 [Verrucomicrobia bacterium]|nr:hypothetical protein [Verrucomicrobiota bacterium]
MAVLLAGWPGLSRAAEALPAQAAALAAAAAVQTEAAPAGHAEHGLTPNAMPVFRNGFLVTNSMIVTWGVALLIILFAQMATRSIKLVPTGAQNFWEWLVESL